ncbi:hypothetical protein F4802DRAFT_554189 [Xylaria palmicola]|nr:hypothetical protein F4802DRAFT_554189 [Xylaria palmicola]
MAAEPAPVAGRQTAKVEQLKIELARLKTYKTMAEYNLSRMGVDLTAALQQGWVSRRAEARRRRTATEKAAEDEKWAAVGKHRAWLRKQHKKGGVPVFDPAVAYRERVAGASRAETAERLHNRVRRMSQQVLIAAAIGKQFREVTMADGADQALPQRHWPVDARSEAGLSVEEAMARSFRNWTNHEEVQRLDFGSQTPETVVTSSGTSGSDYSDSSSGSSSDSSLTDDDDPDGPGIPGPGASRGILSGPARREGDNADLDANEAPGGLADLDVDDVSDEIMATAYAMVCDAEKPRDGREHWTGRLAKDVLRLLRSSNTEAPPAPPPIRTRAPGSTVHAGHKTKLSRAAVHREHLRQTREKLLGIRREAEVRQPSRRSDNNGKGPSQRAPHKPAAPCRSVYDPTWWRVNAKDPDDGVWVRELTAAAALGRQQQQPADPRMETGFVTWGQQEARFPPLDTCLRLHAVPGPPSALFDPATAGAEIWDPLNRAIAERKKKTMGGERRQPLRLGPVTMHSLARWDAAEFGIEYPRDPVRLPDNPAAEEKKKRKRSTPSSTAAPSAPRGAETTGEGWEAKPARPGPIATTTTPLFAKETPAAAEATWSDEPTPVASVHYPLKSPAATTTTTTTTTPIAQSHLQGQQQQDVVVVVVEGQEDARVVDVAVGVAALAATPTRTPTPTTGVPRHHPTPSPRWASAPGTPASGVPLSREESPPPPPVVLADGDVETPGFQDDDDEEEAQIEAFLRSIGAGGATDPDSDPDPTENENDNENENEKRPAAESGPPATTTTTKKRRPMATVRDAESEDESESESKSGHENVLVGAPPPTPMPSRGGAGTKKSVRFDFREDGGGPSGGMQSGARRALGRLNLTSRRRGPLGPYV